MPAALMVTTARWQPQETEKELAWESPEIPGEKAEPREGTRLQSRRCTRCYVAGMAATRPVTPRPSRSDSEGRIADFFQPARGTEGPDLSDAAPATQFPPALALVLRGLV